MLEQVKNVLNHSTIGENDKIAYITRPFIKENLYDRISTRPFLIMIEKTWIAYQLVSTVAECHLKGVSDGHSSGKPQVIIDTRSLGAAWRYQVRKHSHDKLELDLLG